MRKKFNYFYFGAILLLIGIINVVLFLLIEKEKLQSYDFWFSWSMFTWGSILFDAVYFAYLQIKRVNIATVPALLLSATGINIVLIIVNLVFTLSGAISTAVIITNAILAFLAIAITSYLFITSDAVEKSEAKQEKKVFYIRDLESDVINLFNVEQDEELKNALDKLADNIKNSDPMSNEALEDIELDIKIGVADLAEYLNDKEKKAEALDRINKIQNLLESRNLKARNLK